MTERLYYNDSYTTEFTARVVERTTVEDHPALILDRTYFYPTGGGQPNDLGAIDGVAVMDVITRDSDHAIVHILEHEVAGDEVEGRIDWQRRFDHMQQHSGQHILTQAFVTTAGANTIGFHLGSTITIDLDQASIGAGMIDQAEDLANRIVQENRAVTARILDPQEAERLGTRIRRIPGHLATGGLRVIDVEDFDLTACGGTHVARTGEIGMIKVLKIEKYKGGSRVEFACGGRALADYRQKNALIGELAGEFGVGQVEVREAAVRLKVELRSAQGELKKARGALAAFEIPALLAAAEARDGLRVIRRAYADRDAADVRNLASRLVEEPGTIALLGAAGEKAQLILARSADLPHDMIIALRRGLAALDSDRGGGRPEFAQGGGIAATVEQVEAALREAEAAVFETAPT